MNCIISNKIIKKIIITIVLLSIIFNFFIPIKVEATKTSSKNSVFDADITYEYDYLQDEGGMLYALYTPSTATENKSLPMIVWLHGMGEFTQGEGWFKNTGLLEVMNNWSNYGLEGISAYILCPHSNHSSQAWTNSTEEQKLKTLLDNIIEEKNIDKDNIFLAGHSSGANGAIYMACHMPEYFSKIVLMSGFGFQNYCTADEYKNLGIETRAYTGDTSAGEFSYSVGPTKNTFEPLFGSENTFYLDNTSHGNVPKVAFTMDVDEDGNGRSDLFEWFFDSYTGSTSSSSDYDESNLVESEMTGLNTFTGIILEPTISFFTYIIDSVMSVFTGLMRQEDIESVMLKKSKINDIEGEVGATYTIEDMGPYKFASGMLKLKYPNFKYSPEEIFSGEIDLLDINFINASNSDTSWNQIRNTISQWYQILRMIAIVGLLSVLIYIGIKIILSSETKDKAKYREMLINWFIGVVLAFSMHYIMAFILSIVDEITALLKGITGLIDVQAGDVSFKTNLIGIARFQIQQQHFTAKVGNLIIYTALVVYTFKFTFVYLKRVLYMAFLTIISPIVALTYPIDKANDGAAQGFEIWLKEFTFNALLQPMHYILYYVLVSSSLSLSVRNPVYAIVALMFISQAEKLLKRIFGFGKAKMGTVGGIAGSFATGAVTSSLMKHMSNPLHPFGGGEKGGKGNSKDRSRQLEYANNFGEIPEDITRDTNVYDFLGQNILEGMNDTSSSGPSISGIEDSISKYRAGISEDKLEEMSFDDGLGNMQSLLRRISQCENKLANPNLSSEDREKLQQKLSRLNIALQNRLDFNEAGFDGNMYPLQYTDGDNRSNSELTREIMDLWGQANNASSQEEKNAYHTDARRLMKKVKRRMAENQYIQKHGGPQNLWQGQEKQMLPETDSSEFVAPNIIGKFGKGMKNVGKTIVKPVWDTEKGTAENVKNLGGKVAQGVVGASVGIAAATVQAGISITDGKYNPLEGVATIGAGIAGVSQIGKKLEGYSQQEIDSIKKYGEQWFNRDDVINVYKNEFAGQGKEMRKRAVRNYISRGITDTKDQIQAMKFAEQLQNERGMDQEEADKLAIATLQYKKSLVSSNSYSILYDEKSRKKYIDTQADAYMGAASKDTVKQLHNDFIQNVREFERANN